MNIQPIADMTKPEPKRRVRSLDYVLRREIVGKYQYHVLRQARGILHVGANMGQEAAQYDRNGLDVLWIEPIDAVFAELQANIAAYPRQRAIKALVTDQDGSPHTLHIASNGGSSSSILELGQHTDIFPNVTFVRDMAVVGVTLTTLVEREKIDIAKYDMLLLDTQGSELLVLKGAIPLLQNFRFVQVEAADFEAYKGCAKVHEIDALMATQGFVSCHRKRTSQHPDGGQYFEITYGRERPNWWARLKV